MGYSRKIKAKLRVLFREFKTNPSFVTPVLKCLNKNKLSDYYVIYPEIVSGTPLRSKMVIRWFLHHPGFHTGKVSYNSGELYFTYGNFGKNFSLHKSYLSSLTLEITHFFTEYYNLENLSSDRKGSTYCLKG